MYGAVLPRIAVVLLMSVLILITASSRNFKNFPYVVCLFSCLMLSFLIGVINNGNLAFSESKIFVFLAFYIFIISYDWNKKSIFHIVFISSWCVNIIILSLSVSYLTGHDIEHPWLPESNFVIDSGGQLGYSLVSFQSLSFFFCFNLVYFVYRKNIISLVPCVLGFINIFINNRRALILFPLLVFCIFYLFFFKSEKKIRLLLYVFISVALMFFLIYVISNISGLALKEQIFSAFDLITYDSDSDDVRIKQLSALTSKLLDSPIWGWGIGAYTPECIRNDDSPYAYELMYNAYLMKFGLLGFIMIFGSYIVVLFRLFVNKRNDNCFESVFWGVICLMLCSATNPYINVSMIIFLVIPFVWNDRNLFKKAKKK